MQQLPVPAVAFDYRDVMTMDTDPLKELALALPPNS
jgi:hypothetical protein